MSTTPRAKLSAPFRERSFRFQWPADLAASWAFEMENIVLGWYVLTETGSVVWLTAFAALQFAGTLISPMFGVMGDRLGQRRVLAAMRVTYASFAAVVWLLVVAGALTPLWVFLVSGLSGLVRPSDVGMRNALIGATMPPVLLMGALGIERTSADSARIAGALTGAGLVALLGMADAYLVVTALYAISVLLLFGVGEPRRGAVAGAAPRSPWRDLGDGLAYVRHTPPLLAAMCLAFLANCVAYPVSHGLLPYVAREVYGIDRTGLGYLSASFAAGALTASLVVSAWGGRMRPGRTTLLACFVWFSVLAVFARVDAAAPGMALLGLMGFLQSLSMVPMSALLLRLSEDGYRGRVMGIRMLAVYGLPVGLMVSGPAIEHLGFAAAITLSAAVGLACAGAIALRWGRHLWPAEAPANR